MFLKSPQVSEFSFVENLKHDINVKWFSQTQVNQEINVISLKENTKSQEDDTQLNQTIPLNKECGFKSPGFKN